MKAGLAALAAVLAVWRPQLPRLAAGAAVAMAGLAAMLGLMAEAGGLVAAAVAGSALAAPLALRLAGGLRVVLRYAERLATHDALFRALAGLRVWFFRGLAARTAGGLGFRRTGDVLARLVDDIDALDVVYLRALVPLAAAGLLVPLLAVWIGRNDPALAALVVLLLLLAAVALPLAAARAAWQEGGRIATATAGLRAACLDTLAGLREVRAFGAEGRMLALVQGREAALLAAQHRLAGRAALAGAGAFLCAQAALLAILWRAPADPAALAAVAFLAAAGFEAIQGLARAGVAAGHAAHAARRLLEVAAPLPADAPAAVAAAAPEGHALRLEGVAFRWQPDRPPVFDGLTLDIPAGARVALLGPSGAGKSSLAALLLKVVRPERGRILLGGADLADLPDAAVRARCAWLSQATHLFSDTIRANLLIGRPEADEAALWAALEAAQLAELVRGLPDGLDTWVGEGGFNFSGGQGRRLALARALLAPAPILILDEPCAGLDAATERAFLAGLDGIAPGRTLILIAHRLTGAERLDRIWRLSGGRAVAAAG